MVGRKKWLYVCQLLPDLQRNACTGDVQELRTWK
jgi:hypothetical protein